MLVFKRWGKKSVGVNNLKYNSNVCKKQLQVIFDRSADLVMIYATPVHNYTDYVLEELGLGDAKDVLDNKK